MFTLRAIAALCFCCLYQSAAPSVIDGSEPFFRKDYEYVVQQEAWYKVHREPRSWYDAYQHCKLEGATLLYPRDTAEDTLLQRMVQELQLNDTWTWVGAHGLFAYSVYIDLQGKEISEYNAPWSPGEPNRNRFFAPCVAKHYNGLIDIESCLRDWPFVCKRSIHDPVVVPPCGTFAPGYFPNADSTRCYKLHKQPKTWLEAYKVCREEQSYLVEIDDEEEAKFVVNLVLKFTDRNPYFNHYNTYYTAVGFHDRFAEGDFVTLHGKNLNEVYNRWKEGEPNNHNGNERYGSIELDTMLLNDIDGFEFKTVFVCEKEIENPYPQTTTPQQDTTESSQSQ